MRGWWLGLALLAAPMLAAAQAPLIEPSAALDCLTPAKAERDMPEYPFEAWKGGRPGRVQIELEFSGPDRKPQARVLAHEGDDSFVDAVRAHVRQFRVPCIDTGTTRARVVFDFVFKPDERKVVPSDPTDPDHEAYLRQLACVRHTSGKRAPEYPTVARRSEVQGRVHLQMEFFAADQPPRVTVSSARNRGSLHDAIEEWATGYRMPCYEGPAPVTTSFIYVYVLDGSGGYGFKPISFQQFLSAVQDIGKQRLDFDFTQMGCPFDVRMTYLQPRQANWVGQLGDNNPARKPFVDWLRQAKLNLPARSLEAVFADSLTLTIPCTRLNLNPQEQ